MARKKAETAATPTTGAQTAPEGAAPTIDPAAATDTQGGTQVEKEAAQETPASPSPEGSQAARETQEGARETRDTPDTLVICRVLKVTRPLMRGDDVAAVHAALIAAGLHCGKDSTEGIYGAQTAVAVRHFQAMNRLIVSGKVEKFTARALGAEWEDSPAPNAE